MDYRDRRKYPRLEGEFPVELLNMGDDPNISPFEALVEGIALDISRQGMRIKSDYNVGVGSYVSAILYYKQKESICLCEVVWRREENGVPTYGLYFKDWTKLDPELDHQLQSMETPTEPATPNGGPLLAAV